LGTAVGSVITINSNAAESYANGVFVMDPALAAAVKPVLRAEI